MEKKLNLKWEITAQERKSMINTGIFIIGPLIIFSFIGYISFWNEDIRLNAGDIIYASVGMIVAFTIAFLVNSFIRYRDRSYCIDDNGITITKGQKTRFYAWQEFESYYNYSERSKKDRAGKTQLGEYDASIAEKINENEGDVFYLKKRAKNPLFKIRTVFVVVYGKIDNSKDIDVFLERFLEKREMKNFTDLGLVLYKFK